MTNIDSFNVFLPFFSASNTQIFLHKCYDQLNISQAEQKSYENCYPFIYYLEHAQTYYNQANRSPLSIRPTLLFYGFIQLLKACLLTTDPNYPESTSQLAHGVTTRKRKKQQYEFLKDEVKVQKNGLITCVSESLFQLTALEGEKYSMESLLTGIPEMEDIHTKKNFLHLKKHEQGYFISNKVLDYFQMTEQRFLDFLSTKTKIPFQMSMFKEQFHIIPLAKIHVNTNSPIRFNIHSKSFGLALNKDSKTFTHPEIILHYLLLYNLSMISRYETEWWMDLLKTTPNNDYPAIVHFLNITQLKIPFLISEWLKKIIN